MHEVCVKDYLDEYDVKSIDSLDVLETKGDLVRLALTDGENSIWVCDYCGELADPDEGCFYCEGEDHEH